MSECQVCGNELARAVSRCPFCGSKQEGGQIGKSSPLLLKTVNLERGLPLVETALRRLEVELQTARREKYRVVILIHGYGSSGKGGAIGKECRKTLDYLCHRGELNAFIPGEKFNRKAGPVRALLHRYPWLAANHNLNKKNPGITIVIL